MSAVRRALALAVAALTLTVAAPAALADPPLPSADPFYSYNAAQLNGVAPGTILRERTISNADLGTSTPISATQVLYRTSNEAGQPAATVTTIISPSSGTSPTATKIVSYQTAYDALGSVCDPSYTLQGGNSGYDSDEQTLIGSYVDEGYTVIDSDYEGTNLDWGAGQESGYTTLDGIRAAENLLKLPVASTPVGMVGYSGGSIATEFASELAPTYAPKLDIVGVAEGGIPVDFAHNLTYVNGSADWSGVIPAVLVGVGRGFGIDIAPYLSAEGTQITNTVSSQCINNFLGNYPGLTIQQLLKPQYQNFLGIPIFAKTINHLIMSDTGTPKGPLFIGVGNQDGTGDGVMIADDDEALAHTYCQRGVSVQFNVYSGQDHDNAAVPFEAGAQQFLAQRLNGLPVTDGCSSIGTGNSLARVPVPSGDSGAGSSPGTHAGSKPAPKLRMRYLGRAAAKHGVAVSLWTTTGSLTKVTVRLRRAGRTVDTVHLARVRTRKRRVILRVKGKMPRAGRYTVTAARRGKTLDRHTFRLR
ncbi:MAG TPA: lipase family protein [Solirubrobacteraceae bacterium]|nr:lipase family protein [Solirubrobacteraceae bacterium]